MKVNLFILGLGGNVDTIRLLELFSIYGTVEAIHLPADKQSGKLMGYGFIEMTDQQGAERAIEGINDKEFNGRKLTVRVADKKEKRSPEKSKGFHQNGNQSLPLKKKRPRKMSS